MVYVVADTEFHLRIYAGQITSTETTASCPTKYVWEIENQDGSSVTDTFLTLVDYPAGHLHLIVETSDFNDVGTYNYVAKVAFRDTDYGNAGQIDITL